MEKLVFLKQMLARAAVSPAATSHAQQPRRSSGRRDSKRCRAAEKREKEEKKSGRFLFFPHLLSWNVHEEALPLMKSSKINVSTRKERRERSWIFRSFRSAQREPERVKRTTGNPAGRSFRLWSVFPSPVEQPHPHCASIPSNSSTSVRSDQKLPTRTL